MNNQISLILVVKNLEKRQINNYLVAQMLDYGINSLKLVKVLNNAPYYVFENVTLLLSKTPAVLKRLQFEQTAKF